MSLPKKDSVMKFLKVVDQQWIIDNMVNKKKPVITHMFDKGTVNSDGKQVGKKYVVFDESKFVLDKPNQPTSNGYGGKFEIGGDKYPSFWIRNSKSLFNVSNEYEGKKVMGLVLGIYNKNSGFLDEGPFISVFLKGINYHIADQLKKYGKKINFHAMNSTKLYKGEDVDRILKGEEKKDKNQLSGFKINWFNSKDNEKWGYEENKAAYKDKNVVFTSITPNKKMKATYTRFYNSELLEKAKLLKDGKIKVFSEEKALEMQKEEANLVLSEKTKFITQKENIEFVKELKEMKSKVYTYENINDCINKNAIIRKAKISLSGYWVMSSTKQLSLRLNLGSTWFVPGSNQDEEEELSDQEEEEEEDNNDALSDQDNDNENTNSKDTKLDEEINNDYDDAIDFDDF
jgi:hypothetical protein